VLRASVDAGEHLQLSTRAPISIDEANDMRTDDNNTFAKGSAFATFSGDVLTQHFVEIVGLFGSLPS
jgi:hypothetical protein